MTDIISIQSHVAYGYVGNRAAVFPLQRLGWEVSFINTVQFSNHTGYADYQGEVFSAAHLQRVVDGMASLTGLDGVQGLLTGYMGDPSIGGVILDTLQKMRRANPQALYCCDPVMGDPDGGCYVRDGVSEWMRDQALPAADIITPNQFELSRLVGREITTMEQALTAAAELRDRGPAVVLLTSMVLAEEARELTMVADTAEGSWQVTTPILELKQPESGAGDFTAATFLAGCLEYGMTGTGPARAMARTAVAIRDVLETTIARGQSELALIPAQDKIAAASADDIAIERLR